MSPNSDVASSTLNRHLERLTRFVNIILSLPHRCSCCQVDRQHIVLHYTSSAIYMRNSTSHSAFRFDYAWDRTLETQNSNQYHNRSDSCPREPTASQHQASLGNESKLFSSTCVIPRLPCLDLRLAQSGNSQSRQCHWPLQSAMLSAGTGALRESVAL